MDPSSLAIDTAYCVDEVNRLRAKVGVASLRGASDIEAFSSEAARVDGQAHEAHKHFKATNGGHGVVRAENVIPWWPLARYGSVNATVREGLAMMWAEGPGGSHYETMRGNYSEVGCGVFVQNGEVTVSQAFR